MIKVTKVAGFDSDRYYKQSDLTQNNTFQKVLLEIDEKYVVTIKEIGVY